jgi:hypothetical protein
MAEYLDTYGLVRMSGTAYALEQIQLLYEVEKQVKELHPD